MSRGKTFERELLTTFKQRYPDGYVERNTDRMAGRGTYSAPSPPDMIINTDAHDFLIECKVVKGISIPLSRLSPHQHDYLIAYDRINDLKHGLIALQYYRPRKWKKAWLIPITYWSNYQGRYPRKSLAMKHLEDDIPQWEMTWDKTEKMWLLPQSL